jgi:hypothetical protein
VHQGGTISSIDFDFPGSSGWAWIGTAGDELRVRLVRARLSAEVRTSYLMRDHRPVPDLVDPRSAGAATPLS